MSPEGSGYRYYLGYRRFVAVLNYRSIDPAIARLLLGDDAPPVPVILMAGIEEVVR